MHQLDLERLPRHVAIIMDGNGRWAKKRFLNRIGGHEEGANSVRAVVRSCRQLGIPYLTLYAFSKENWQRPAPEVNALWHLLKKFLISELPELLDKEIRLCHIGDIDGIPEDVVRELLRVIDQTRDLNRLVVNLAVNYGGRQEIERAARLFAADVQMGKHSPEDLSTELFSSYLFTGGVPDPDLIIRTSGEYRVSNFLLWQLAYAELYITDVLWPDFREENFLAALSDYQRRDRRFGTYDDQMQTERYAAGGQK